MKVHICLDETPELRAAIAEVIRKSLSIDIVELTESNNVKMFYERYVSGAESNMRQGLRDYEYFKRMEEEEPERMEKLRKELFPQRIEIS